MSKVHPQPAFDRELAATAALRRAGVHVDTALATATPPPEEQLEAAGLAARQSAQKRKSSGFYDGTGSLARFNTPTYLAWDNHDRIVVVDAGNHSVRRVTMQGVVSTVAGGGDQTGTNLGQPGALDGPGIEALFDNPGFVVVDADGTIVVADTNNNRLRQIVGDTVTAVALKKHIGRRSYYASGHHDGEGHSASNVPLFGVNLMTLQRDGTIMIQSRPGSDWWYIVVDCKLKEPAWFKMYREGVRRRWCEVCRLRLGRLKRADQSSLDISERTVYAVLDSILRMVVDESSFLDEGSKGSLLRRVQAFGARMQDVRRASVPLLAAPENTAHVEHGHAKRGRVKLQPTPIPQ
jgi:hypothetical protein